MSLNYQLALDVAAARAYARRVDVAPNSTKAQTRAVHSDQRRGRRPPNPAEQAKRVAWGKRTGGEYHALKIAGRWK